MALSASPAPLAAISRNGMDESKSLSPWLASGLTEDKAHKIIAKVDVDSIIKGPPQQDVHWEFADGPRHSPYWNQVHESLGVQLERHFPKQCAFAMDWCGHTYIFDTNLMIQTAAAAPYATRGLRRTSVVNTT